MGGIVNAEMFLDVANMPDNFLCGTAMLRDEETGEESLISFDDYTEGAREGVIAMFHGYSQLGLVTRDAILTKDMTIRNEMRDDPATPPEVIKMTHTRMLYLFETPAEKDEAAVHPLIRWTCEIRFSEEVNTPATRTIVGLGNSPLSALCFASGVVFMMSEWADHLESVGLDPDTASTAQISIAARDFWLSSGFDVPDTAIPFSTNMGGEIARA